MVWIYFVAGVFAAWTLLGLFIMVFKKPCQFWVYRRMMKGSTATVSGETHTEENLIANDRTFSRSYRLNSGSPWNSLFFNPVYLHRLPLKSSAEVRTDVVIGPHARRPLCLRIPILIAGMGCGTALSSLAKQALALAATKAGTASNTGIGPLLPEERAAAEKMIVQYSRGQWVCDEETLRKADAIEIQLGQGAWGPLPLEIPAEVLIGEAQARRLLGLRTGQDAVVETRVKGVHQVGDLQTVVENLRQLTGVPIGVKLGATHGLEREIAQALQAGVDFLSIDGAEGGSTPYVEENHASLGIPTLFAVVRARRYLDSLGLKRQVSLLIGGGLDSAEDFLKAMALGADAVFIGRPALAALIEHLRKTLPPWESPWLFLKTDIAQKKQLNPHLAADGLEEFIRRTVDRMKRTALTLGKKHLKDVSVADLCALDRELARWAGIGWVGETPSNTEEETVKVSLKRFTIELPSQNSSLIS